MRGRKPQPTHLKLVKGNPGRRPMNENEPTPPREEIPAAPAHLTANARPAWERLAPLLHGMGVLTAADVTAFERACECYAEIRHCQTVIETLGGTYETRTVANGFMVRARPEVAQLADADRRFRSWVSEFGLTPAARTRIKIEPGKSVDPIDSYFT